MIKLYRKWKDGKPASYKEIRRAGERMRKSFRKYTEDEIIMMILLGTIEQSNPDRW